MNALRQLNEFFNIFNLYFDSQINEYKFNDLINIKYLIVIGG